LVAASAPSSSTLQPASYIALGPTESPADAAAFDVPGGHEPGGDVGVAAAVALAGGAPLAGEAAAVRRTVDAAGTATTGDELDWDLVRVVRAKENEQGKRAASFFDPGSTSAPVGSPRTQADRGEARLDPW
jgi:hypothetical protein